MTFFQNERVKGLAALLDRLEAGVLITDKLGRVLFANATFRKLSGCAAGAGLPKSRAQELQALLERVTPPIATGASINTFRDQERAHVLSALNQTGGKIYGPDGAAALLGMPPTTLMSRLRKYGVPPKRPRRVVVPTPMTQPEPEPEPEPEMLD